jgi:hypothetical protein
MKCLIISIFGLLMLFAVAYVGNSVGYKKGFDDGLVLQSGTFVTSLDALEKLRSNDTTNAIEELEKLCFSAADTVYERRTRDNQFVAKSFIDELKRYRRKYRSNKAEWTPMEKNLETKLATWK